MNAKYAIQSAIRRGNYDLKMMLDKIDMYHIEGALTADEREELASMARQTPTPTIDYGEEIQALWSAVNELRETIALIQNTPTSGENEPEIDDYKQPLGAHDAYFNGAVVRYNGKVYRCVAPDKKACVWSPDTMPGWWEELSND